MDKLGYDTYILEVKYLHFLYCFIAICSHCMGDHRFEIDIIWILYGNWKKVKYGLWDRSWFYWWQFRYANNVSAGPLELIPTIWFTNPQYFHIGSSQRKFVVFKFTYRTLIFMTQMGNYLLRKFVSYSDFKSCAHRPRLILMKRNSSFFPFKNNHHSLLTGR